jgi:hypothetical protein
MPLIESASKKARSKNIATEIRAGKPPKQAEAIGYSIQRKAEHSKTKGESKVKHMSHEHHMKKYNGHKEKMMHHKKMAMEAKKHHASKKMHHKKGCK